MRNEIIIYINAIYINREKIQNTFKIIQIQISYLDIVPTVNEVVV